MTHGATIKYCGVPMAVEYDYNPAERQTREHPGSPAYAEVTSCKVGGVEILDMLSNEQIEAIDTLILEERGSQDQDDAAEEYHRQRDERDMEGFLS